MTISKIVGMNKYYVNKEMKKLFKTPKLLYPYNKKKKKKKKKENLSFQRIISI